MGGKIALYKLRLGTSNNKFFLFFGLIGWGQIRGGTTIECTQQKDEIGRGFKRTFYTICY